MRRSFAITTLGCKVNRYESEAIGEALLAEGWRRNSGNRPAELSIINTCTVTAKAAAQSRQAVRKQIRDHGGPIVVATGCGAQSEPQGFAEISGVHYVVGNSFKGAIARLVGSDGDFLSVPETRVDDIRRCGEFQDLPITRFGNRTRCFVKIQDGCDAFCSYCIVPYVRGPSRSLRLSTVLQRLEALKTSGYSEAVLCGIHLGRYGEDLEPTRSLFGLIRAVDELPSAPRLRLSSVEPLELSEDLIDYLAVSRRVCPHLHIPLQSGDDGILAAMNRPYGSVQVERLTHQIKETLPDAAIGMDVLVGFPGETERAFDQTCALIRRLPVSYLHVFPFSPRAGTPAASLPNPVPSSVIKARCRQLRRLGRRKRHTFHAQCIGRTAQVIFEGQRDRATGRLKGFTANYIPVRMEGAGPPPGDVTEVRLDRIEDHWVVAKPLR